MAINKKLIHFNNFSTFNSKKLSANSENTKYTLGIDGDIVDGNPEILYQSICYIKDTQQQWTHGQLYDCSSLVSGENIKTINNQSILGEGNIVINEPYRAPFNIGNLQEAVENGFYTRFPKDVFVTALKKGRPLEVPIIRGISTGIPASYYRETTADGSQIIVDVIYGTKVYHLVLDDIEGESSFTISPDNTTCKDTSDVYITPYTLSEFISAEGRYLRVSKEFAEAAYNKKMILIPTGKTVSDGHYVVATNVEAYDPTIETYIHLGFYHSGMHYDFYLETMTVAPADAYCNVKTIGFVNMYMWEALVAGDNIPIKRPNIEGYVNSIDGASFTRNGVRTAMTPNTVYNFTDNGVERTIAVYDDHRLVLTSEDETVALEYHIIYTSAERVLPSKLPSSLVTQKELRETIQDSQADWLEISQEASGFIKNRTHYCTIHCTPRFGQQFVLTFDPSAPVHSLSDFRVFLNDKFYKFDDSASVGDIMNFGVGEKQSVSITVLGITTSGTTTSYTYLFSGQNGLTPDSYGTFPIQIVRIGKTLDPIYLPEDVVYEDKLPQSDWNESDDTKPTYVNNRTHFAGLKGVFNIGDKFPLLANTGTHSPESYRLRYKGELYKLPSVGEKAYYPNEANADFFIFLSESTSGSTTVYTISSTVINEAVAGTEVEVVADYISKKLDDFYLPDNVAYNDKLKTINGESIVGEGDIKTQPYIADFTMDDLIGLARNDIDSIEVSADILDAITENRIVGISIEVGDENGYTIATRAEWAYREELYLEITLNGVCYIIDGVSAQLTDDRKFTIYSQSVRMLEYGVKPLYIDWVTLEEIRNAYDENGKQGISIPYPNEDAYNKILEAVGYEQQVYIKSYDYGSGYAELNIGTYEGEICCSAINPEGYLIQFNITSPSEESLWIRRIDYLPNKQDIIEAMTPITWAELINKRDNEELIAGTYYRITDYETTTAQEDTGSACNLFDVIVLALSENSLAEEAYAVHSERDTDGYFANSNLSAWKLWYCLDNDTTRFAWADESNGKGVIYRMIDEWNNDFPYDFKNILFTRYELKAPDEYEEEGENHELLKQLATNVRNMFDDNAPSYKWSGISLDNRYWEFDYEKIYSQPTSNRKLFYTFSDITGYEDKDITLDASLSSMCHNNKMELIKQVYAIELPNSVFFGKSFNDNNLTSGCCCNSFGNYYVHNNLGDFCVYSNFGDYCQFNSLGYGTQYISLGDGNSCNSLGTSCYNIGFGNSCSYNSLGDSCYNIFFNSSCYYNSFGNDCYENTLSQCYSNSFGNDCSGNILGLGCECQNNILGNNVSYVRLLDEQEGYEAPAMNYRIENGVQGTYEEPIVINVTCGKSYETTIAMNSNGEIVEFCVADFPSLIIKTLNTPV